MVFCLLEFILQVTLRENLLLIFTSDKDVLEVTSTYFLLIPVLMFFDFTQCVIQGTIKALGQ